MILAVLLEVVADDSVLGDGDVFVDDGAADARPAADIAVVENDGVFDAGPVCERARSVR
jgi:hypothetical protein